MPPLSTYYARALVSSTTPQTRNPGGQLWAASLTSPIAGLTIHSPVKAYFVKRLPTLIPAFRTLLTPSGKPSECSHLTLYLQGSQQHHVGGAPGSAMDDLGSHLMLPILTRI